MQCGMSGSSTQVVNKNGNGQKLFLAMEHIQWWSWPCNDARAYIGKREIKHAEGAHEILTTPI